MTLREREERLEIIKKMNEQFSYVSSQLKTKAKSFEILSNMCEYLVDGLNNDKDLDYDSLEMFIKKEYERIVNDYDRKNN